MAPTSMGQPITQLIGMCVLLSITAAASAAEEKPDHRVWLDVDPANGIGEIDDGLAMIQAFHSSELEIAGVSAVFGNAPLKQAYPIALNVTRVFGPEGIKTRRGAAAAKQLGEPTDASKAMARALQQGPMTILALGPVTNVGTLLQNHSELAKRIEQIVVVAGRRSVEHQFISDPDQPEPFSDFNFEHDPAAMRVILDSKVPLVMAPWEVSSHIWLTREDLTRLKRSGGSGLWIAATSQQWIDSWEQQLNARGGNPFDTLAVGYLTHPGLIAGMPVKASIQRAAPPSREASGSATRATKPYLVVDRAHKSATATIYLHTPKERFKAILMQRLAGPKGLK